MYVWGVRVPVYFKHTVLCCACAVSSEAAEKARRLLRERALGESEQDR